ncbi:MAG: class I SAM-dependent methyltransferase [Gammaproteobacteria bacterium]|jgi:ubiquinone/menaquinone biosynthesis C-methylase UbiE
MDRILHNSAKPSHYNKEAKFYDENNEQNSKPINQIVEHILKKHGVKSVFDLTCGTGSQVVWLAKRKYEVIGSDINLNMLRIAKKKSEQYKLKLKFLKGDMRTIQIGKFDAAITMHNAIGHLTKFDFEKAIKNIYNNLNINGLYIFDIDDLDYLNKSNNISKLTIDWQEIVGNTKIRTIQYSTVSQEGILVSYTTQYVQKRSTVPELYKTRQTLQIYTAQQLKNLLHKNGFRVLNQCALGKFRIYGSKIDKSQANRILTIAKKC